MSNKSKDERPYFEGTETEAVKQFKKSSVTFVQKCVYNPDEWKEKELINSTNKGRR